MTKFELFVAAIAISTAFATPALAQWQSQEPGQFAAEYPNGDHAVALSGVRDGMAFVPSMSKSSRHMMAHAAKG
jgi:hypothetical protein